VPSSSYPAPSPTHRVDALVDRLHTYVVRWRFRKTDDLPGPARGATVSQGSRGRTPPVHSRSRHSQFHGARIFHGSCHPHGFRGRQLMPILPARQRRPAPGPGPRLFWPPSLPHITAAKVTRKSAHPHVFAGALYFAPHCWLCAASVDPEIGANKYVSCRYF